MKKLGLLAAIIGLTLSGAPAGADQSVSLDAERIAHLSGLTQIDGRKVDPARLRGRPVVVSFFASWCPPCNAEFEHMKLLHLAHAADGLEIIAINLFEDFAVDKTNGKRLDRFLGRHTPVFPVVAGSAETAKLFGNVKRIPTVFVFDRQGRSRMHFIHAEGAKKTNPELSELRRAVRDALGFGAADLLQSLPETTGSVSNPAHFLYLAESTR